MTPKKNVGSIWDIRPYPFIGSKEKLGVFIDQIHGNWDPEADNLIKNPEGLVAFLQDPHIRASRYDDLSPGQQSLMRMAWDSARRAGVDVSATPSPDTSPDPSTII